MPDGPWGDFQSDDNLDTHYDAAGKQYDIDPDLLRSIHQIEDPQNDPYALSPQGAEGWMQFLPSTARSMGVTDTSSPRQSIYGAARYLRHNADYFGGRTDLAIAAYHGGPDTDQWGPRTRDYHTQVTQDYERRKARRTAPTPDAPGPWTEFQAQPSAPAPGPWTEFQTKPAEGRPLTSRQTVKQLPMAPTEAEAPLPPMQRPVDPAQAQDPTGAAAAMGWTPAAAQSPYAAPTGAPTLGEAAGNVWQAAKEGFGEDELGLSPKSTAALQRAGVFPQPGGGLQPLRQVNEAILRPVVTAVDTLWRAGGAGFAAFQSTIYNTAKAAGASEALARDMAASPEAFMGMPHGMRPPGRTEGFNYMSRPVKPGEAAPEAPPGARPVASPELQSAAADMTEAATPRPAAPPESTPPTASVPPIVDLQNIAAGKPPSGAALPTLEAMAAEAQTPRAQPDVSREAPSTSKTTPEPAADIRAQLATLADPANPKDAVFVAAGTPLGAIPPNATTHYRPEGVLITTNPAKGRAYMTGPFDDAKLAQILGYPESKAQALAGSVPQGEAPTMVQGTDAAGNVVHESVASPAGVPAAAAAAESVATPAGGRVRVVDPVAAQVRRGQAEPPAVFPDAAPEPRPAVTREGRRPSPYDIVPREPERLASFLHRQGGVQDIGGDISSSLGGARYRPGLINQRGLPLDEAAQRAGDAGYFPQLGDQRPSINDLREALHDDLNERPRYSHQDEGALAAYQDALARNTEIDRLSSEHGIPTTGLTYPQFFDALANRLSSDAMARTWQSAADAHEAEYAAAEAGARAQADATREPWTEAEFYGQDQARSLESLTDEYRQEDAALAAQQRPEGGGEPVPAAGDPGAVQASGGPRPGGAGDRGRNASQAGAPAAAPEVAPPTIRTIAQIQREDGVGAVKAGQIQQDEILARGRPITAAERDARRSGVTAEPVREPAPEVAQPAERPVDARGNPIFAKGDRVVLSDGNHGTVSEASSYRMQSIIGGPQSDATYMYVVKTDRGRVVHPHDALTAETGEPPTVPRDPVYAGHSVAPEELERQIGYDVQSAKGARGRADRAKLPANKRSHIVAAEGLERTAAEKRAVLAAWKGENPPEGEPAHLSDMRRRIGQRGLREDIAKLYQRRLDADPERWKPGQGVSYQVAGATRGNALQTNRGFRIVEVSADDKQALLRSVADTGLTTTGGDFDAIPDTWHYLGDMRRDQKYDVPTERAEAPEAATVATQPGEIVEHTTKRGKVLRGAIRTDLDREQARAIDPYSFRKDGGWFIRETAQTAPSADVATPASEAPKPTVVADDAARIAQRRTAQVERMREQAAKLEAEAQADESRDRQANTPRRARMAASASDDARARLQIATTMRNLADAIEAGDAPHLVEVSTRAAVEQLDSIARQSQYARNRAENVSYGDQEKMRGQPLTVDDIRYAKMPGIFLHTGWAKDAANAIERVAKRGHANLINWLRQSRGDGTFYPTPEQREQFRSALTDVRKKADVLPHDLKRIAEGLAYFDRLAKIGIKTPHDLRAALIEYIQFRGGRKTESPLARAERELVGQKPGIDFFPTPKDLAARLIEEADIEPGMRVLEPSAGKGDLADAAREAGAQVDTVEMSDTLRTILEAKGHSIVGRDFMDFAPTEAYDRVVMNPPFSNNMDAAHVQRAYDMLKPGGRLVAITGEGIHFRTDRAASAFRQWMEDHGAQAEKLPEGSFKSAFRPTGVATRLLVVDKPAGEAAQYARRTPLPPQGGAPLFGEAPTPEAPKREPEPTIRSDTRQVDMFGTADAAVQAQAARDQVGRGALAGKGPQAKADEGLFAPKAPDEPALFSRREGEAPQVPLYSAVARAADALKQAKGTGAQMLAMLQKTPGVKPEELRWLGLDEWLKGQGHVTKAQVQEYIRANTLDVREVTKGAPTEPPQLAAMRERYQELTDREEGRGAPLSEAERAESGRLLEELSDTENPWLTASDPKFAGYQLPGGENYREMLITLPEGAADPKYAAYLSAWEQNRRDIISARRARHDGRISSEEMTRQITALEEKRDELDREAPPPGTDFRGSHWDEPNVLAHIRFSDRVAPDGKRTLLVEEVQSDWHQKGRKHGYASPPPDRFHIRDQDGNQRGDFTTREEAEAFLRNAHRNAAFIDAERSTIVTHIGAATGVPDAPFKTTWPALTMKRMVKYAVDNGYDRIAWTPGEQQTARYDLSRHVSDVAIYGRGDDLKLSATDLRNNRIIDSRPTTRAGLADLIGKEVADRLLSQPEPDPNNPYGFRALHGVDLKVGGEGMRGFYDRMLPNEVSKIVGKYGAKVGKSEITDPAVENRSGWGSTDTGKLETTHAVHSVDITDSLRSAVGTEGLPLFAKRDGKATPVKIDPEAVKKLQVAGERMLREAGLPPSVALKLVDRITDAAGNPVSADAKYTRSLISLALDTPPDQIAGKLFHEIIHGVSDAAFGLLKPGEIAVLNHAADRWLAKGTNRADLQGRGYSPVELRAEAIARLGEDALARGLKPPEPYSKIARFVERLGNWLRGQGFRTADDVFNAVMRGEKRQGEPALAPGASPEQYALQPSAPLPPPPPPPTPPGPLRATIDKIRTAGHAVDHAISQLIAPMRLGSTRAQAWTTDLANGLRQGQYRYGQIDREILRHFNPSERQAMGRAMDAQSVHEQVVRDLPEAEQAAARASFDATGQGLAGLPKLLERQTLEQLDALSADQWRQFQDLEMVAPQARGLPFWFPRQIIQWSEESGYSRVGGDGHGGNKGVDALGRNLTTAGPMRRKHLTPQETEAAAKAKFGEGAMLLRDIRSLPARLAFGQRAIDGVKFMNELERVGRETGVNLVVRGDIPGLLRPGDYFTIADHPSFRRWTGSGWQAVHVAKEFEGPLKAVLTKGSPDLYRAVMAFKSATMHAIMWSPMIHLQVEIGRSLPIMLQHPVMTATSLWKAPQLRADLAYMDRATRDGLAPLGQRGGWSTDPVSIADQANVEGRNRYLRVLGDARDAAVRGTERVAGQFAADVLRSPSQTLLWDRVFDLQVGLYDSLKQLWTGKFSPEVAGTMAAHIANRYAGALPAEHLSRGANMLANLMLFSRSFTLGNLGVIKDVFRGAPGHILARIEQMAGPDVARSAQSALRRKAISAFVMDIGMFYVAGALLQTGIQAVRDWLTDAAPTFTEAARRAITDWGNDITEAVGKFVHGDPMAIMGVFPQTHNEPGKEGRVFVGTDSKDRGIYGRLPIGKVGEEFVGWFAHPGTMMLNKLSPLVRPIMESVVGSDTLGRAIYKPDPQTMGDRLKIAGDIVAHIVKAQLPMQTFEGLGEMFQQHVLGKKTQSDPGVSAAKVLGPFTGLLQMSSGYPGGPAAGETAAFDRRLRYDQQQAMPEIRTMVRDGKIDEAMERMLDLGMERGQIRTYLRQTLAPGPSAAALRRFERMAPPDVKERMERFQRQRASPG